MKTKWLLRSFLKDLCRKWVDDKNYRLKQFYVEITCFVSKAVLKTRSCFEDVLSFSITGQKFDSNALCEEKNEKKV